MGINNPSAQERKVKDMTILYVANGYGEMVDISTIELDPFDDDN